MNDSWNKAGVSWSNENIERELSKVEEQGQRMANKFLRDKLVFLAVVFAALIFSLFYLDTLTTLAVEIVIFLIAMSYLKKVGRRAQAPVYIMCDPYLEFAYIRAYSAKPFPRGRTAVVRQTLSLAQCMGLAGETQASLAILSLIEGPEKLKPAEKTIYYNTILLCYGINGWADKRRELVEELKRLQEKAGRVEAMQLAVILRMEELKRRQDMGDIKYVEDYFKKFPPALRFQEVGMHYTLGMMYIKQGDVEQAREHVEFVLDYGNKLYYRKKMENYLRSSLEDETGEQDDAGSQGSQQMYGTKQDEQNNVSTSEVQTETERDESRADDLPYHTSDGYTGPGSVTSENAEETTQMK